MSTHGAYGFKLNNKFYITESWSDSYPTWLGAEILELLREVNDDGLEGWVQLRNNVSNLQMVEGHDCPEQSFGESWADLLRPTNGAEQIRRIYEGEMNVMIEGFDTLEDGEDCRHAYIINLDDGTFEFYSGGVERCSAPDLSLERLPLEHVPNMWGIYPIHFIFKANLLTLNVKWKKESI